MATEVTKRLASVRREILRTVGVSSRYYHPSALRSACLGPNAVLEVPTELVLDAASELLEMAEVLHRLFMHSEAFALEGMEGRLIEALLGAGPIEERREPAP